MSSFIHDRLRFAWDATALSFPPPAREGRKPLFMLRKMMPEYVWDLTHLEDNPFTFVEVKTLLDGITVGGHRVADEQQVLNQRRALKHLEVMVEALGAQLGKELALQLHAKVAFEEALEWGKFREGQVGIGGTSYQPPAAHELESLFEQGIDAMRQVDHPFELALVYFFWGAMNQFFFDGNKRTSRAIMNFLLLRSGFFYLSVPGRKKDEFNSMMVQFYDTGDATAGMRFMLECYRSWD
jgi:Fic family protein